MQNTYVTCVQIVIVKVGFTVPTTNYVQSPSLVLCDGSSFSECAHSGDIRFESLLLGTISLGCKLN